MRKRSRWCIAIAALLAVMLWAAPALAFLSEPKDINGDGYDDVAAMYKYPSGRVGFWAFDSSAPTTTTAVVTPRVLWKSGTNWGNADKITPLLADVTGDFHADVIAAYAYGAEQMGLWVTPGSAGPSTPTLWWKSSRHGWAPGNTKLTTSKSLSGTGPRNPVALYKAGGRTQLWAFTVHSASLFTPTKIWQSSPGSWTWSKSKVIGGDFNGDGKGDVAILYDYGHGTTGLWTFISNGTGYDKHLAWRSSRGGWNWSKSKLLAADVDGDGKDEVVVAYKYTSQTGMWVFQPTDPGATVMTPSSWGRTYGFLSTLPITLADVNHDHKADIVIFGPGTEDAGAAWDMLPSTGSSFETDLLRGLWESAPGAWKFSKARLIP